MSLQQEIEYLRKQIEMMQEELRVLESCAEDDYGQ